MDLHQVLFFILLLLSGLAAGLFFAFSNSVMPGLGQGSDLSYLKSMQSINRVILNPFFFVVFLGTPALCLFLAIAGKGGLENQSQWFWIAFSVYILGVILVSALKNVPLNQVLDKMDLAALDEKELSELRERYSPSWERWNLLRTISSLISFLILLKIAIYPNV